MTQTLNFNANEHIENAIAAIDADILDLQTKRTQIAAMINGTTTQATVEKKIHNVCGS